MKNNYNLVLMSVGCLILFYSSLLQLKAQSVEDYQLIAHRGGVVDSLTAENSIQALQKAVGKRYWMVEVDLRLTKDSVLITHHDRDFQRYYGVDKPLASMTWAEVSKLKGDKDNRVLLFEEVLRFCRDNGLQVMIDNKISGFDSSLFTRVYDLVKQYGLEKEALMIGTTASTRFFTGKIRLSCTRSQLEENMLKTGYDPSHYYLFSSDISPEDAQWAADHDILAVGVINAWAIKEEDLMGAAEKKADQLKGAGLRAFQIDSVFEGFF
jgi:glycerophosphoryl diester phosphodiesterase